MKKLSLLLCVCLPVFLAAQELFGEWTEIKIDAPSLSESILETSTKQKIGVLLPPSYLEGDTRYPVIYFLHGYTGTVSLWISPLADRLMKSGHMDEVIYVEISGVDKTKGSFYRNSPVSGNWEDFVINDVVGYIDEHFRTIPDRKSRGIVGLSMGGYGALYLGIRHTDVFNAIYSFSPGLYDLNGLLNSQCYQSAEFQNRILDLFEEYGKLPKREAHNRYMQLLGSYQNYDDFEFACAYGMAVAPNADHPPYFDYAVEKAGDAFRRDSEVWQRWESGFGGILNETRKHQSELEDLAVFAINCGFNDGYQWIVDGTQFYESALTELRIPHRIIWHDGGHVDRFIEQMELSALPLISSALERE